MIHLTGADLRKIVRGIKNAEEWAEALNERLPHWNINTVDRASSFIGQTAWESGGFKSLSENLNYSAKRLRQVWPRRFRSTSEAQRYARNPEKIANKVYSNRMGNGSERSGDGWKFRGRGLIQLTGQENNQKFANAMQMDINDALQYLTTYAGAVDGACWYWKSRGLNRYADKGDWRTMTKRINGGTHGYKERVSLIERARSVLRNKKETGSEVHEPKKNNSNSIYRVGSKGTAVGKIQEALAAEGFKIIPDGVFGRKTRAAVRLFQKYNGLHVDGVVGPATWSKLVGSQ